MFKVSLEYVNLCVRKRGEERDRKGRERKEIKDKIKDGRKGRREG